MRFTYFRKLNKNERYPTTKKHLKAVFSVFEAMDVLFGLRRKFEFDRRLPNKPNIRGIVVASISCSRNRTINFNLYPVSVQDYSDKAVEKFRNVVLVTIEPWVKAQMNKSDTALLGYEEMVVEWNGKEHVFHYIKFL
ncbi:hypothetical protein AM500_04200 [Bacillus sp. FJAT-18017]|uniref:hypothetical protein n=1 Tax=Bacillus sp. FJAT-18017 TaxID=1705566 RepID=UPI0006AF1471|nr:hypothetical protein [Bacillus sp. FJAT-18017]ALC89083.1 hypothetical protein AM500_04200 [Bacillus sp. FJAT-18017]